MTNDYPPPAKKRLFFLLFLLTIAILVFNCRKIDYRGEMKSHIDLSSKFFQVPADAHSAVKKVAKAIKTQNTEQEFIKKFSKEIGLPVWRKSPVFYTAENLRGGDGGSDTLVFVPLENPVFSQGDQVRISSFLAALVGTDDSVKIRLFRGDRYEGYGKNMSFDTLTSELVAMQCMYLENYVYNDRDTFRINDLNIFLADGCRRENASRFLTLSEYQGGGQDGRPSVLIVQGTAPACVNISLIEYYEIFGYYPSSSSPNVQINGQYCIPYQQWVNYIESCSDTNWGRGWWRRLLV
jgi:lysozyme family protein